jgi:hypothetical protein
MVEILNFKYGATFVKLNLIVQGMLMPHCGRDRNMKNKHLSG